MLFLILAIAFCPSISASGQIFFELTASEDCDLSMSTAVASVPLWLRTGVSEKVSFVLHPDDRFFVRFTLNKNVSKTLSYELRNTGEIIYDVVQDDEITVLIKCSYRCDDGFSGERCTDTTTPSQGFGSTDSSTTNTRNSTIAKKLMTSSQNILEELVTLYWFLLVGLPTIIIFTTACLIHRSYRLKSGHEICAEHSDTWMHQIVNFGRKNFGYRSHEDSIVFV